ncbi:helix-turn-helix transcriptional regulator [Pantoea sp. 18069]|uniref:helix-turn-helix domain-containing protein n=1 Tax=Pantoea sp. 18069 TaxID=2681415 RepID=UPI00135A9A74|nr:helix-turn-helix transcriptional regulator [Pantoea sp. 18069]
MTDSILRRARKAHKLTQVQLAEQVGVNQATLARWETGKATIPDEKASLLSAMLGVPISTAESRSAPVAPKSPQQEERETKDDHHHFGEVAVHFKSGGRPLMVSIDEAARSRIYAQFAERSMSTLAFETLDNRTVYVRKSAISDLHFSGEAVGAFGPEHAHYGEAVRGIASTDVHGFADPEGDDDGDPVDALAGQPLCFPREFWRALSNQPFDDDTPADIRAAVESALGSDDARTYELLATHMFWQVENAKRRGMPCSDDADLSDGVFVLELGSVDDNEMLHLWCGNAGGYHHSVMINFNSLEYLTMPTHMLEDSNRAAAVRDGLVE